MLNLFLLIRLRVVLNVHDPFYVHDSYCTSSNVSFLSLTYQYAMINYIPFFWA